MLLRHNASAIFCGFYTFSHASKHGNIVWLWLGFIMGPWMGGGGGGGGTRTHKPPHKPPTKKRLGARCTCLWAPWTWQGPQQARLRSGHKNTNVSRVRVWNGVESLAALRAGDVVDLLGILPVRPAPNRLEAAGLWADALKETTLSGIQTRRHSPGTRVTTLNLLKPS